MYFTIEVEASDHVSNQNLKVIYFSVFHNNKEEAVLEKRILLNVNREYEE
jgi:hypothetical protein